MASETLPRRSPIRVLRRQARELPDGSTRIELETRCVGSVRPRWLWRRIEAAFWHEFHRHILGAMRCEVESPRGSKIRLERERPLRTGEPSGQ